jgi:hypothetical protein
MQHTISVNKTKLNRQCVYHQPAGASPACTFSARRDFDGMEAAQLFMDAQLPAISGNQLDRDAGRLRQRRPACVAYQPAAHGFCRGDDQQLGRLGRAPI